jgi:hypothetical protein
MRSQRLLDRLAQPWARPQEWQRAVICLAGAGRQSRAGAFDVTQAGNRAEQHEKLNAAPQKF